MAHNIHCITQETGWKNVFYMLIVASALSGLVNVISYNVTVDLWLSFSF